jgi:hypothetical protein
MELARRECEGVYEECVRLLATDDIDDWMVAVDVLGELSSDEALVKLTDTLKVNNPYVRKRVMKRITCSLKRRALAKNEKRET